VLGDPGKYNSPALSFVFICGGFILIAAARKVLYEARRQYTLATAGPYAHVRHPQ
jgi:protein-S-isoprenylcysteine O-methyltransferase Ste14